METIRVALAERSYDIHIGRGILPTVGKRMRQLLPRAEQALIVTDSHVGPLYGESLRRSLEEAGFRVHTVTVPAGEESKSLAVLADIYSHMADAALTREDPVVTLGGGVVGDLGGLAAATYLRGLPFIQVPTSLLAQIDSSVGGKTAVDLPQGKNLVGAFHQPAAVYIDPSVLETLPERYLRDGMAEVVKYGCICEETLFRRLEELSGPEAMLDERVAEEIIATCCRIKASIVEKDERDTGCRMLLNFGHTLGHSVERHYHYRGFSHGEGVAVGMALLTERSGAMGMTEPGTLRRLLSLLDCLRLPVRAAMTREDLLAGVAMDKKKQGSRINLVLLKRIGEAFLHNIPMDEMKDYIPESPAGEKRDAQEERP